MSFIYMVRVYISILVHSSHFIHHSLYIVVISSIEINVLNAYNWSALQISCFFY